MHFKKFSDFAKEATPLEGTKLKLDAITNKEIIVTGFNLRGSKYARQGSPHCLTLQVLIDDKYFIVFTGSTVLTEQIEKYQAEIPFTTTVKKIDKYYTFS